MTTGCVTQSEQTLDTHAFPLCPVGRPGRLPNPTPITYAMARHCGKALKDVVYITGANARTWPMNESPFSYSTEDDMYYGIQKMKQALPTTVVAHQEGKYYPIQDTCKAARILEINNDEARVRVEYEAQACVIYPKEATYPLNKLLLVKDYSSKTGAVKKAHSSDIPILTSTPRKGGSMSSSPKNRPVRGPRIAAIVVGPPDQVYTQMIGLSAGEKAEPVTLAITHEAVDEGTTTLRKFGNMNELAQIFFKQGIMDEANQGLSCGVEAVCNAGFNVTARDFTQQAAHGVDMRSFVAREHNKNADANDSYLSQTGGGNRIPPHQMQLTMEHISGMPIDPAPYLIGKELGTSAFWRNHQWAIVHIPVSEGHWVSMERILYKGQDAVCLREGRGNTMYDFMTSPSDGGEERLSPSSVCKRKRF